ncbi:hypothetical protein BH18ACI4_BH18ACI4_08800 [soil metagenome]
MAAVTRDSFSGVAIYGWHGRKRQRAGFVDRPETLRVWDNMPGGITVSRYNSLVTGEGVGHFWPGGACPAFLKGYKLEIPNRA